MNTIDPCQSCRRDMRPRRTKLDDYPGTVARQNSMLCSACGDARYSTRKPNPKPAQASGFEAFIDWLEARRVRLGYEDGTMDSFRRAS